MKDTNLAVPERRRFIRRGIQASVGLLIAPAVDLFHFSAQESFDWYNPEDWGIEGKGWNDTARYFDRLPARAQSMVREAVWDLSHHTAGMSVCFETDASQIEVRYKCTNENLAMPHMPATGVSGLDLYVLDLDDQFRWAGVNLPEAEKIQYTMISGIDANQGSYTLYFPLYNGLESLEIGVPQGSMFKGVPPRTSSPIVFYGTSIMQGACASRPGMAYTNILQRRLRTPMINLGFSGNGRMELELATLISELDAAIFVLDCLPNLGADQVLERTSPFVHKLREHHPETPILLVEDRINANARFSPDRARHHTSNHLALESAYQSLREAGDQYLFYLQGSSLIGMDGEGTTDGSHPNDLGMVRYADAYEPVLRRILGKY